MTRLLFYGFSAWVCAVSSIVCAVNVRVDYSYDTSGFFDPGTSTGQQARASVDAAAQFYSGILEDSLTPVTVPPQYVGTRGGGTMDYYLELVSPSNPSNTANTIKLTSWTVPQDEYLIFAGGAPLSGTHIASAGVGNFNASWSLTNTLDFDEGVAVFQQFENDVLTRGQTSGFAHWGGTMSFDTTGPNWNRNHNKLPATGESDLYSIALHEMAHVLGFSRSTFSGLGLMSGANGFAGANSMSEYGGVVPLAPGSGHWAEGMMSWIYETGAAQETLFDPSFNSSVRKHLTTLDAAGLKDIGWEVADPPNMPGDLNTDGRVDSVDYAVWREGLGQQYTDDVFGIWLQNFGASNHASEAASATPSPAAAALLLFALGPLALRR